MDAQGQLEKLRAREQELAQQETLLGDHLAQYDLDKLRNDSSEATKRRQAGERCESLLNVLEKNQKSLAAETVILRELEEQLTAWEKREAQLIQERESIQAVLPGLEEAYQLAAGEGAEAMRATLRAGECCPVCGSREHPFAAQDGAERYLSPIKTEIVRKRNRQEEIRHELEDKKVGIRTLYSKGVRSTLSGKNGSDRWLSGSLSGKLMWKYPLGNRRPRRWLPTYWLNSMRRPGERRLRPMSVFGFIR